MPNPNVDDIKGWEGFRLFKRDVGKSKVSSIMPNPNVDVIIGGNQMFSKTFFGLPNSSAAEMFLLS